MSILRKGIPFIYQGQEIGMENQGFTSIDDFDDISNINEYHVALTDGLSEEKALEAVSKYSRDNDRTPMQWTEEPYLGFSTVKPWLMGQKPNYQINVRHNQMMIYLYYSITKKLTDVYKYVNYGPTIQNGEFLPIYREIENLIAYERVGEYRIQVITNFQASPTTIKLSSPLKKVLINNYDDLSITEDLQLTLQPYQSLVILVD